MRSTDTLATPLPSGVDRTWRLVVCDGPNVGRSVTVGVDDVLIGADGAADLVLDDPAVSRRHAIAIAGFEGVLLNDLGSKNGVRFAGCRVDRVLLPVGCTVQIGRSTLEVAPVPAPRHQKGFGGFVTAHPPLVEVLETLCAASRGDASVLIEGETGTGKELLARAVHDASPRAAGPFVVCDCTTLQGELVESTLFGHERGAFTSADRRHRGLFECAEGGTLFFDELGELPMSLQPKLLRACETRRFRRVGGSASIAADVRFVAATNRDLEREVAAGRFRADLFYRLAVVRAAVPPLRDRSEDIRTLADAFVAQFDPAKRFTAEAQETLEAYEWPGNARELRNVVERATLMSARSLIRPPDLFLRARSPAIRPYRAQRDQASAEFERRYVDALLARFPSNLTAAARAARLSRQGLYDLLKRTGRSPKR